MNRTNKKRKLPSLATVLTLVLMLAAGFGVGWLVAWQMDRAGLPGWQMVVLLLAAVYLGMLVQIGRASCRERV